MTVAQLHPVVALSTHDIDEAIFHVADALQVPVLILALLALALVIFELGSFAVEVRGRRRRRFAALLGGAERGAARRCWRGDRTARPPRSAELARSAAMADTLDFIVEHARTAGGEHQLNKALADFDFDAQRRLGAHPAARPRRPGARADGDADPALAGAHRPRQRQHDGAEREPAGRVQRHRRRSADRRGRVRARRSRATACTGRTSPTSSTSPRDRATRARRRAA